MRYDLWVAVLTITLAYEEDLRALFDEQLSKGRAFVLDGEGVNEREPCELVIELGDRIHRLAAEVVHVRREDPGRGVGLQLARLDAAGQAELRQFVEGPAAASPEEPAPAAEEAADARGASRRARDEMPETGNAPAETEEEPSARRTRGDATREEPERTSSATEQRRAGEARERRERLQERVALERMYGPNVWETLLRNNRLTPPEAARIARKGTLPRPSSRT